MFEAQLVHKRLETLTIFGEINRIRCCAENWNAFRFERICQFEWCLAAELDDDPVQRAILKLNAQDFHDVLKCQWLEIETVRCVIIRRNRFRVTIDHDRLVARVCQCVTGMTAAVVELNPLADTIWATAKDDDFLTIRWARFAFNIAKRRCLVCGVHVGRLCFEFGCACIDALEHGFDADRMTGFAHIFFFETGELGETGVCEAHHFEVAQASLIAWKPIGLNPLFRVNNLANTGQEPRVKHCDAMNFIICQAVTHRLCNGAHTVWRLLGDGFDNRRFLWCAFNFDLIKSCEVGFHRRERLLQALMDGTTDSHGFTHGFHSSGKIWFRAWELLESEFRDFGDDIVDGRLERRRRYLCYVVVEFIERVSNSQLRRDLGNREACCFGRKRRGARNTWVHFDNHHASVGRVHRPLHVGAACFHADFAQNCDGVVAHHLVFFVRESQRRSNGDRIACVNAHWIDVFDGADDNRVVCRVAHDFHFIFFPTQKRLVHENLVHW